MDVKTRTLARVNVGDELPELVIAVTTKLIVAGAVATQDFTPVHHDKAAAQAQGLSDIIMNTLTTNGFVGRYITDWTGPNGIVKSVALKLGAPNYPGDTLKLTGRIKAIDEGTGVVDVQITGTNSWGDHVTGTVKVALPAGD
jgi:acyl dehydratase